VTTFRGKAETKIHSGKDARGLDKAYTCVTVTVRVSGHDFKTISRQREVVICSAADDAVRAALIALKAAKQGAK
jgi:hypothetical protein